MEEIYVSEGDTVIQGQVIGKMGRTGRVYGVTGIHLHFELEYESVKVSPSIMNVW
jgi:murein DD-endopeptidase MepM/ murein hydrolase activator NlpD